MPFRLRRPPSCYSQYISSLYVSYLIYVLARLPLSGREQYQQLIVNTHCSVLEVLDMFPSCKPPVEHVLDLLPPLLPRYYSVTSSPLVHPSR